MIRPADPKDRAAAESVVQEAYSIYLERMEKPPGPTLDDYGALIAQGLVSVAEDEISEIAAVVVLMPKADHLLLDNVAVRPDRQGQGYGRRMITFAESEARRLGFAELRLYTHEKMVENIALYTRLGFVETSRGEQAGYSRVFMTKFLGCNPLFLSIIYIMRLSGIEVSRLIRQCRTPSSRSKCTGS